MTSVARCLWAIAVEVLTKALALGTSRSQARARITPEVFSPNERMAHTWLRLSRLRRWCTPDRLRY